jgi:hypothetical protein
MINSSGDLKIETLSFHLVELTIIKRGRVDGRRHIWWRSLQEPFKCGKIDKSWKKLANLQESALVQRIDCAALRVLFKYLLVLCLVKGSIPRFDTCFLFCSGLRNNARMHVAWNKKRCSATRLRGEQHLRLCQLCQK